MAQYRYGFGARMREEETAKAQQYNIDASYKDLCAVCSNLRGLTADEGVQYLEAVLGGFPVLYKRWNKHLGHRKELGGRKGRYPVKSAKYVLLVLKNAIANASGKGLDSLTIVHVQANKQAIYPRTQSKGKQFRANYETARVEVVLAGKKNEKLLEEKKEKSAKKAKAKEAAAEMVKGVQSEVEKKTEEVVKEVKTEKAAEKKVEAKPAAKK
ncbi:50S ribosomal protein L22 [uncultured archaeon]|nr:50S ribosomal protein L22 [uncultured archaeon]